MQKDLDVMMKLMKQMLNQEEEEGVIKPKRPEEHYRELSLKLEDEGIDDDTLYSYLADLVSATPRTATRTFFNQLFGGRNAKSSVADMLASFMNNSMYTYKVGGPMILMEKELLGEMQARLGFGKEALGTMAPGGSMTNMMGMIMARDHAIETTKTQGVQRQMTMYTSECSHYSLPKNASFIGIGRENMRYVKANEFGQMDTSHLKELIQADKKAGKFPFLVVATAGTTVMGAFDDINSCADICETEGLWLHVDGAYCGSVMFSKKYGHLIDGSSRANSFSFNAHKMMSVPMACSFIFAKDKSHLYGSFSNEADYLYQTADDDLNPGKVSLQCGRRNDALKFWVLWKSLGSNGLEKMVDHEFEVAQYARDYVRNHPDYTLYNYDNSVNICFNYKGIDPTRLCNLLYEKGELMVGYGKFAGTTFVRQVAVNAGNSIEDMKAFFEKMEDFVETHEEELISAAVSQR